MLRDFHSHGLLAKRRAPRVAGMTETHAVVFDEPKVRAIAQLDPVMNVDRRLPLAVRAERMPAQEPGAEALPDRVIEPISR